MTPDHPSEDEMRRLYRPGTVVRQVTGEVGVVDVLLDTGEFSTAPNWQIYVAYRRDDGRIDRGLSPAADWTPDTTPEAHLEATQAGLFDEPPQEMGAGAD